MVKVGEISQRTIDLLGLAITAGTPIYLGDSNIEHIANRHPEDFEDYGADLENILKYPDYVGLNQVNQSIEYVKVYTVQNISVKVAVRVSTGGNYFVRSLYARDVSRISRAVANGQLLTY